VVPGDQLRFEIEVLAWRHNAGRMGGQAFVDGKLVCEATVSCAVVSRNAAASPSGGSDSGAAEPSASEPPNSGPAK
jgi:3-hydroxyacyl-[acyl-carrier-protein] dehydratase